MYCKELADN